MSTSMDSIKKLPSSKPFVISIIILVSFAVYFNTLWNGFVYDDEFQVLGNPWIKDVKHIPDILFSSAWAFMYEGQGNYYRPLMHISYMADYHLFGLKPWGFHLTNVILHAGVSALVFLVASKLLGTASTQEYPSHFSALAASLLFATHPIHTEAVAWVASMPELMFSLFYLLSFYLYIKRNTSGERSYASLVFFFFATLSKETALTLPLLLFAYEYSFNKKPFMESVKKCIPYLTVAAIYFILRTYAIGGFAPLKRHAELSGYEYFINIFPLFMQYIEKLVLPINLNAFYVFHPIESILEWRGFIAVSFTSAFIFLVYLSRKMSRTAFFGLLWIALPLLPVLYIPALGKNTFAERYLYLPSVGFVILMALALERIYCNKRLGQTALPIMLSTAIVFFGLYCAGTVKRNFIWRDNYALWADTVEKSPDGAEPHNSLANAYRAMGLIDEAIAHYNIALGLNPDFPEFHNNVGAAYGIKGTYGAAIEHLHAAIKLNPGYYVAHNNLGFAYYNMGVIDNAIKHYQIAVGLMPIYAEAHYNLGLAYSKKGLKGLALKEFELAARLRPNYFSQKAVVEKSWQQK